MKKLSTFKWFLIGGLFITPLVYAQDQGLGGIAANLFTDAMAIRRLIRAICIITGACFILGAILQYKKYRDNPTEVRLSMPIMSLITGLALIGLAFIPFKT